MNAAIFGDIAHCGLYFNCRFGGTYHFDLLGRKSAEQETSVKQVAKQRKTAYTLMGPAESAKYSY
jgi:hypothetical protein